MGFSHPHHQGCYRGELILEREVCGFLINGVELKSSQLEKNLTKEWEACNLPDDGMGFKSPPS
jgi:hypothetical protein